MSKTYVLRATKMAMKVDENTYDKTSDEYTLDLSSGCYVEFEELPEQLKNIIPSGGNIYVYIKQHEKGTTTPFLQISKLNKKISIAENIYSAYEYGTYVTAKKDYGWVNQTGILSASLISALGNRGTYLICIRNGINFWDPIHIKTVNAGYAPYLELNYDEGQLKTFADRPVSYADRTKSITFSWHTTYSGFPIENITQTSATLQWKNGANGTVNSIAISGSSTTYMMPANTLPKSNDLYWRVVATTASGTTSPEWTQIRTTDTLSTATAISPSAVYVDGTKNTRFVWEHSTDTGTAQTAYDLQIKTSVADWTTVKTDNTEDMFCDLPADTLPSGTIQWRVRTYNADGVSGAWSNALTVVVIAAPQAPNVQIDVVSPRPKVSWTSQDQQAYQVQMGSYDSGLVFGTAKSFQCPVYLPDGSTRARVRVLNEYNLWSAWREVIFTIANAPGTAPDLTVDAGCDARLTWGTASDAIGYWIYRDQECIAKVTVQDYVDRLAIGRHTYFVRAIYADSDNYADSNTVAASLSTDHPIICELDGEWISLRLSVNSMPSIQISIQQNIALSQYAGLEYPVPEISPYKQRSYSISTAYAAADTDARVRFERLLGKRVCVKDQYENLIVGIITNYQKTSTPFYTAYTAVVNEIDKGAYRADD